MRVHLGRRKAHFIRVAIAGCCHTAEYFTQFGFVIDQLQQRLAVRSCTADSEEIFCGGVHVDNQQAVVKQDDARAQAVQNVAGVLV